MNFGQRLRELRAEKKMRQEDLANVLKVHRATVGKYETNERSPDKETLQLLADYFNVSIDYLLGRTDIRNAYESPKDSSTVIEEVDDKLLRDIAKIYKNLSPEEQKELARYAKYLKTRDLLEQGDKESSSTSEVI